MPYWICEVCNNENLYTLDTCEVCGEKGLSEEIQRARALALKEEQEEKRRREEAEKEEARRKKQEEKEKRLEKYKQKVAIILNGFVNCSKVCFVSMNSLILFGIGYLLVTCFVLGGVDATRIYLENILKNFMLLVTEFSLIDNIPNGIEAFLELAIQFVRVIIMRLSILMGVFLKNILDMISSILYFFNIFSEDSVIRKLLEIVINNIVAFREIIGTKIYEIISAYF